MSRRLLAVFMILLPLALTSFGCSEQAPLNPVGSAGPFSEAATQPTPAVEGQPGYEPAYYDGDVVIVNAIEVSQHAAARAQADLYEVVYPVGWEGMGIAPPQCNPCDHEGNGLDFTDYHDHVLDSVPSSPGHGEYRTLWRVYVVLPAYTGDPDHDAAVGAAYGAMIPAASEDAVETLVASHLPDGSPVALEIDTEFYFLCAVVNQHAWR